MSMKMNVHIWQFITAMHARHSTATGMYRPTSMNHTRWTFINMSLVGAYLLHSERTWAYLAYIKLLWKHLAPAPQHPMNDLSEISFKIASSLRGWSTFISSSFLAWRTNLFVRDAFVTLIHFILVLSIASWAESFSFVLFRRFAAFFAIFSFCLLFDRRLPIHGKWIKYNCFMEV